MTDQEHSFAVMAHDHSPYLEDCIKSLLDQNKKSDIYISTSTPSEFISEIAQKYDLKLYENKERKGIVADWNFALEKCRTPYVTLAHQDDIYYPEYTQKLLLAMKKAKDPLIAFSGYEELVNSKKRAKTKMLFIKSLLLWPYIFKKSFRSRIVKRLIVCFGSPICCPSVMYNQAGFQLKFNDEYRNNMDWDAWIRLSKEKGSFVYVRQKLMAHRIHEDSETTRQIANAGRSEEDLAIFKTMWPNPIARLLARLYKSSYKSNKI